jgi:hypothetical protein
VPSGAALAANQTSATTMKMNTGSLQNRTLRRS